MRIIDLDGDDPREEYTAPGAMTLEDFLVVNVKAAMLLHTDSRRAHLVDLGEHPLDGMTALLKYQLSHRAATDITPEARRRRELRQGAAKRVSESPYKGVTKTPGRPGWYAQGSVNHKTIPLGYFPDAESAARAYDAWAAPLGKQTNANLGRYDANKGTA